MKPEKLRSLLTGLAVVCIFNVSFPQKVNVKEKDLYSDITRELHTNKTVAALPVIVKDLPAKLKNFRSAKTIIALQVEPTLNSVIVNDTLVICDPAICCRPNPCLVTFGAYSPGKKISIVSSKINEGTINAFRQKYPAIIALDLNTKSFISSLKSLELLHSKSVYLAFTKNSVGQLQMWFIASPTQRVLCTNGNCAVSTSTGNSYEVLHVAALSQK